MIKKRWESIHLDYKCGNEVNSRVKLTNQNTGWYVQERLYTSGFPYQS